MEVGQHKPSIELIHLGMHFLHSFDIALDCYMLQMKVKLVCGSNFFQVYFDDAKDSSQESRVKQVSRIKESFNQSKFQESRLK